jgi:hypothetical protein
MDIVLRAEIANVRIILVKPEPEHDTLPAPSLIIAFILHSFGILKISLNFSFFKGKKHSLFLPFTC